MAIGEKLGLGVGTQDLPAMATDKLGYVRVRLETGAGFDRTITFKKRPLRDTGKAALTPLIAWYKKELDGTIAGAALTPGASNKSEYLLEVSGGVVTVEVSGGTAGTVDVYWNTILGTG